MPWKVFYSYAHEDQELCERLGVFLAPLKRQGKIIEWYDRKIEPAARDRQSSVQAKHVEAYQRLRHDNEYMMIDATIVRAHQHSAGAQTSHGPIPRRIDDQNSRARRCPRQPIEVMLSAGQITISLVPNL